MVPFARREFNLAIHKNIQTRIEGKREKNYFHIILFLYLWVKVSMWPLWWLTYTKTISKLSLQINPVNGSLNPIIEPRTIKIIQTWHRYHMYCILQCSCKLVNFIKGAQGEILLNKQLVVLINWLNFQRMRISIKKEKTPMNSHRCECPSWQLQSQSIFPIAFGTVNGNRLHVWVFEASLYACLV